MPLTDEQANQVLKEARWLVGKTYADMDCSNYVWKAFHNAGLEYPYRSTATFAQLAEGKSATFEFVAGSSPQPGDVLLFSHHMGIWDPKGCSVLTSDPECKRLDSDAPVLSSRSGGNRGPSFGRSGWFGAHYKIYRWRGSAS